VLYLKCRFGTHAHMRRLNEEPWLSKCEVPLDPLAGASALMESVDEAHWLTIPGLSVLGGPGLPSKAGSREQRPGNQYNLGMGICFRLSTWAGAVHSGYFSRSAYFF